MIKIKAEGPSAKLVCDMVHKTLTNNGVKVSYWHGVTPKEVASCRRAATRQRADVSIVAMRGNS